MKKTQIIEALRNIKKQKVSYISIVLITMCAVTAFLGVSFGSYSLAMGGSEFYDRQNFRDLEIVSAVMFSDSDLQKIAAVEGVSDVEGQMRTNAKLTAGGTKTGVNVLSKTERINLPLIKEGSMPSAPGECAVESGLASDLGLNIGDTIILDESENTISLLTGDAFKITAIVDHPDHLVVPNTYTNYVIVPFESFDSELLQGRKILAEVVIDKPEGINRLDKKYTKLIAPVSERLEALSAECAAEALSDMWQTKEEYIVQLKESYIKPALSGIIERYTDRTLEEAEQYVDSLNWSTPDFVPDLNDKDLDARVIQILSDVSVKLTDLEGLIGSLKELAGELVIPGADGDDTSSVLKQLIGDEQLDKLNEFLSSDVEAQFKKLSYAAELWNTGHERYLATLNRLNNLTHSDEEIGVWVIMSPEMNVGFVHLSMSVSGIRVLAIRFTSLFILVGAIVIYATVGKLVDEQRKLVGATKAFGFYNREIFGKYMLFGGSATLLGSVLGALAGIFLLQFFAIYSYSRYYLFDTPCLRVIPWQLIVVPLAGMLITFLAVLFASIKLLRSPAIRLMQDTIPAGSHRSKGKKSNLSLYQRLILRNMRSDTKRVAVTIVSIAGCCALIVIGFSIYMAVKTTITRQFDHIMNYNSVVTLDKTAGKEAANNVDAMLDSEGLSHLDTYTESTYIRLSGKLEPADYVVTDLDKFEEFFKFNRKGKKWADDYLTEGVLIPGNYAKTYNLKVGDTVAIVDGSGNSYKAKVAGVFEFYLGKTVVMSKTAYEYILGRNYTQNSFIVKHDESLRETLTEKLKAVSGFETIARADEVRVVNESYSDLLAIMVVILVGTAALMAAVILTNLVNIYILQKKRELTIMRVNGFTTKEVKNYVSREAILTTVSGIILGVAAGLLIVQAIFPGLSKTYTQFVTTPNIWAILLSAVITAAFTVIIYHFALKKIKDLKLTDIA